ncbi:polysaccharide deacetylase family protein [Pseudarthrobacter sp. S9]|uniref:polysaccharide deacetylase family protein n=1 Tax=Pseudarthrobacter sp. S9 TaxID=3418421 RepID=UPI003D02F49C
MCEHYPSMLPATLGRRAAVGLLGASLVAALGACAAPGSAAPDPSRAPGSGSGPGQPLLSVLTGGERNAAVPGALRRPGKRIRRTFIPDFTLPPVQNGMAPVLTRVITKQPVVFLTIDDGVTKTPEMGRLLAEYDYPATIFLTRNFVQDDPGFFKQFEAQGSLVENHTISHNVNMSRQLGYQQQLAEITGMQDYAQQQFGRRPTLFRPPGGDYSNAMRQAVAAAGMKAVVTWEAKANAGRMDYQYGNSLRPGDIVLMHFRPEFAADLAAFRAAQLAAGLEVVLLENFLGVA